MNELNTELEKLNSLSTFGKSPTYQQTKEEQTHQPDVIPLEIAGLNVNGQASTSVSNGKGAGSKFPLQRFDSFVSQFTNDVKSKSETTEPVLKHQKSQITSPTNTEVTAPAENKKRGKKKALRVKDDLFPDVGRQWKVVDVVMPETLPEGFQFEARAGDDIFTATVPKVTRGQIFATKMGDISGNADGQQQNLRVRTFRDMEAPPSRWRDNVFDCTSNGFLHPFLLNSLFCPLVALAQIMAWVQMSNTGDPVVMIKTRTPVCYYVWFVILLILVHIGYFFYLYFMEPQEDAFLILTMPLVGLDILLLFYFLYMVTKTRKQVRMEYNIPELRCRGHKD